MDTFILFSIILCWLFLLLGLVNYYRYHVRRKSLTKHINEVTIRGNAFIGNKKKSTIEKIVHHLGKYADDFSTVGERINFLSESSEVEVLLQKSGSMDKISVSQFQGFKIVFAIIGLFISLIFIILGLPLAEMSIILMPILGFGLPIIYIRTKAKQRQEKLRRDLPDFLDTVSISLQAGAGLDAAIKETIIHYDGPLQEEFARFMYEIDLGVPRERAYAELLKRNDNLDFQSFIKSLMQGSRLGVPVANTFKMQSEEIRKISIEQVKEKAAKASPKVTLITSLFIAPLVMMMILGLVILNMIYGDIQIMEFF